MKTLPITIALLFLMGFIHAQSPQYATAMKDNLEKMGNPGESRQAVAATFERIAQAEKTQWLPYYYAVLSNVIQSLSLNDMDAKDKLLDHAQELLDAAFLLHCDSSECMVVQGFLYIAKLQADPMTRGAEFSVKANSAFDKAIKLNPENPRGYYLKGTTVFNTPDFYGGGKVPAKPILTMAAEKFKSFKASDPFAPNWGKEDCEKQLAACQ